MIGKEVRHEHFKDSRIPLFPGSDLGDVSAIKKGKVGKRI